MFFLPDYNIRGRLKEKWKQKVKDPLDKFFVEHRFRRLRRKLYSLKDGIKQLFTKDELEEELKEADHEVYKHPKDPIAYLKRGLIYEQFEREEDAVKDIKKAKELGPYNPMTYLYLTYFKSFTRKSELIQKAKDCLKKDPNQKVILADIYKFEAEYYFESQEYDKCIEICSLGIKEDPKKEDLLETFYFIRGKAQFHLFRFTESEKDFEKAVQLLEPSKTNIEPLKCLYYSQRINKSKNEKKIYSKIMELDPNTQLWTYFDYEVIQQDCMYHILSFLPLKDLANMSYTNKEIYSLSSNSDLWAPHDYYYFGENDTNNLFTPKKEKKDLFVPREDTYKSPMDRFINAFKHPKYSKIQNLIINRYYGFTHRDDTNLILQTVIKCCKNLKYIQIDQYYDSSLLIKVIEQNPNLEFLDTEIIYFERFPKGTALKSVKALKLGSSAQESSHCLTQLFPNLEYCHVHETQWTNFPDFKNLDFNNESCDVRVLYSKFLEKKLNKE